MTRTAKQPAAARPGGGAIVTWRRRACPIVLALGLVACAPGVPENLVIISMDTVRRDHLPTYGYPRDTAPTVNELARRAIVFDNAFAQDTNTNPSHASMFTGLYPHQHGSLQNGERLMADRLTLAEILRGAGFRTGAFVSGATMRREASGLEQGFEVYDDQLAKRRDGGATTERALAWLRQRRPGERYFLFLHLYDAHGPYLPPGSVRFTSPDPGPTLEVVPGYQRVTDASGNLLRQLNGYVDRYDEMIRYVDRWIARLLTEVDFERTVVVVLSDHGESLGERYWKLDHGAQVFDEQIRIPWVLYVPGGRPRRVGGMVETIDLLPTLLELLDVEAPAISPAVGKSLVPLLGGDARAARELVFASSRVVSKRYADRGYLLDARRRIRAVRSARWKLIQYPGREEDYFELYDLDAGPGEADDLAELRPGVRDSYREQLREWSSDELPAAPDVEIDPEIRQQLEALGYIGGQQPSP